MNRTGNLFDLIIERPNLRRAVARAMRGKRHRPEVREFVAHLEVELDTMRSQLLAGAIPLGTCRQFVIRDPKRRVITAPCFRERVLHHAVMNVCEPVFERRLIDDTYACRRGRGRVAALKRAANFSRRWDFYLKLDIRKYFDSVPHNGLLDRLTGLFKDTQLLLLLERIVRCFRRSEGRGLPIGSLTSQHFANYYLGEFDRHIKERCRLKGYVRYMDDMVIWSNSRAELRDLILESNEFLRSRLDLEMKAPLLNRARHGFDFLGCRVYQNRITLSRRSRRRFGRKIRRLEQRYTRGQLSELELQSRATALTAFTRTEGVESLSFRRRVLQRAPVSGHRAPTG